MPKICRFLSWCEPGRMFVRCELATGTQATTVFSVEEAEPERFVETWRKAKRILAVELFDDVVEAAETFLDGISELSAPGELSLCSSGHVHCTCGAVEDYAELAPRWFVIEGATHFWPVPPGSDLGQEIAELRKNGHCEELAVYAVRSDPSMRSDDIARLWWQEYRQGQTKPPRFETFPATDTLN